MWVIQNPLWCVIVSPAVAHLEALLDDTPPFAEALHDGLVPQDVLLAQMLASLSGLQNQAVHHVEISEEVPHLLLRERQRDTIRPLTTTATTVIFSDSNHNEMIFVSLEHKTSLKYICSNTLYESKLYILFLCQKSLDIKIMFNEDIPTVNISKRNYWLVICIAKNNFKDDFLNI